MFYKNKWITLSTSSINNKHGIGKWCHNNLYLTRKVLPYIQIKDRKFWLDRIIIVYILICVYIKILKNILLYLDSLHLIWSN